MFLVVVRTVYFQRCSSACGGARTVDIGLLDAVGLVCMGSYSFLLLLKCFCLFNSPLEEVHETCKSSGHIVFAMQSCVHCLHKSKQCIQLCMQRQFTQLTAT